MKILAGSARYLEIEGGLRSFDYLMLNLPYRCNYRCTKCCNSERHDNNGDPLSSAEIKTLLGESGGLGARVAVVAGEGEPLLDDRLRGIIYETDIAGMMPYIFTNGSLLDREIAQYLKEHNASLVINVDSLNRKTYEKLSGVRGSFDCVMGNLDFIRKLFSDTYLQMGEYSIRRVAINTVVSRHNQNELSITRPVCGDELELRPMEEFCGDDFVLVYNVPIKIGRALHDRTFRGDIDTLSLSSGVPPLGTTSDGKWCAYMRNGVSVGARGEILLCAYSLESAGTLGNVRENGVEPHIGHANEVVDRFYEMNGHSRCVLRHHDYARFIEELKQPEPRT